MQNFDRSEFFTRCKISDSFSIYDFFWLFSLSQLEELKNSFPDMPAWIAQHYLTQFEHQVLIQNFSLFLASFLNLLNGR